MSLIFRDAEGTCLAPRGSVVAIGAFDGLHRGHRALLERARARADTLGLPLAALSFEPLPRQFFAGRDRVARLSTPRERIEGLVRHAGLVGLLRFDAKLASMTADHFVERVLRRRLNAKEVWVGPEFRFGHERRGSIDTIRKAEIDARELTLVADGDRISASAIRRALAGGEFALAHRLLGRIYSMSGRVVHGQALGRKLGYPTANLPIRWGAAPTFGIFAVRVRICDEAPTAARASSTHEPIRDGVASLGTRPTVGGVEPLLEAHLFDYDGDLYGRRIEVALVAKIRDELRFDSLEALTERMHEDARIARALLEEHTLEAAS